MQVLDKQRSPGREKKDLPVEDAFCDVPGPSMRWYRNYERQFRDEGSMFNGPPCESVVRYDITELTGSGLSGETSPDEVEFDWRQLWRVVHQDIYAWLYAGCYTVLLGLFDAITLPFVFACPLLGEEC
jgi:hypothetical protein